MKVLIKRSALNNIEQIADYVAFEIKMLAKKGLRCATFDKKWVFAYKIGAKSIIIHHIIWSGLLK